MAMGVGNEATLILYAQKSFNFQQLTSFKLAIAYINSWCHLQMYQTLEHWYQQKEHQTAFQSKAELFQFITLCIL